MATITVNQNTTNKPPFLTELTPAGINSFLRSARSYFLHKSIEKDNVKISLLGGGLTGFPELDNWFSAAYEKHEAKTYDQFVEELRKKALRHDYVWEAKKGIRESKQGKQDFTDWLDSLRLDQLTLTTKVVSDREFIESLLFNMDPELCSILRRGPSLKNTGFHEDDLSKLCFSTNTLTLSSPIDFNTFEREARDEWNRIDTRRRNTEDQIKSLSKRMNSSTLTSSKTSSSTGSSSRNTSAPRTTTPSSNNNTVIAPRLGKLTDLEKDWLTATEGCFKCRKSNAGHRSPECNTWAERGYVIPVPLGWNSSKPVPTSSNSSTTAGIRAVHLEEEDSNNIDVPESMADESDSDEGW